VIFEDKLNGIFPVHWEDLHMLASSLSDLTNF